MRLNSRATPKVRFDEQPSREDPYSFLHADHANSQIVSQYLRIETGAPVGNGKAKQISGSRQREASSFCTGVLGDVRQGFLRYAVEASCQLRRKLARYVAVTECNPDASLLAELLTQGFEGRD